MSEAERAGQRSRLLPATFATSRCIVTAVAFNRCLALCHRMTLHIMFSGQMPHTDKGLGFSICLMLCTETLNSLPLHCHPPGKKKKSDKARRKSG